MKPHLYHRFTVDTISVAGGRECIGRTNGDSVVIEAPGDAWSIERHPRDYRRIVIKSLEHEASVGLVRRETVHGDAKFARPASEGSKSVTILLPEGFDPMIESL